MDPFTIIWSVILLTCSCLLSLLCMSVLMCIIGKPMWSMRLQQAHISMDKHTTHKIDHTIYSIIEEWNSAKLACSCEYFPLIKE